jgi:hypothetical protein
MKRIFTDTEVEILIEALESHLAAVEDDIVQAGYVNAADSVIFAFSKDMVATKIMLQFFQNVHEQDDCLFAEGCTEDVATMMAAFTERK